MKKHDFTTIDEKVTKACTFSSDNFVHRLIQNKTDGKLVEYGSGQQVRTALSRKYVYLERDKFEFDIYLIQ